MAFRKKKVPVLGNEVVDDVSGVRGIMTAIGYFLNGSVMVSIHAKGKGTDAPKGLCVDLDQVTYKGVGLPTTPPDDTSHIVLGTTCRDVASGFVGVVIAKSIFMNGCTQVDLLPPAKDGKKMDAEAIDWKRLETIDTELKVVVKPEEPKPHKPTKGGPSRDAIVMSRG